MKEKYYSELEKRFNGKVKFNILARDFTSYKTGGVVKAILYPQSKNDILEMIEFLKTNNINYFICGRATNILISDHGFEGVFIKTDKINFINISDNIINADAGCLLDDVIAEAIAKSLSGLESLSYIPGSVGGGVRMNAGAFGCEVFDKLEYFEAVNLENLNVERIYKKDLKYGYRYVEGIERYFIVSAVFLCDYADAEYLKSIRNEVIEKRILKQPLNYPSAGSVFKRPQGDYASRLIDFCGLKGRRIGGAMVSEKHAGFIINIGNATSSDIYNLINLIKEEVYKKTGINLELEQILVGSF